MRGGACSRGGPAAGAAGAQLSLLDSAAVREQAKLVPLVALAAGSHIDLLTLLPWSDARCDGLPQKRLVLVCAATLLVCEAPMLSVKAAYRYEARTGLLAVLSIALSLGSLYRGIFHKVVVFLIQRKLDREGRQQQAATHRESSARTSTEMATQPGPML